MARFGITRKSLTAVALLAGLGLFVVALNFPNLFKPPQDQRGHLLASGDVHIPNSKRTSLKIKTLTEVAPNVSHFSLGRSAILYWNAK